MPQVAKQLSSEPSVPAAREAETPWTGTMHGVVGDMHRVLEERLLAGTHLVGPNVMAVLPLPVRPMEALVAGVSRAAGWTVLGGCFATAGFLLLHLA